MRALKILAVTLACIVAVLIVGCLLLVSFFDPNDYKSYVADYVERETGRSLLIEDDLELSFFPWLAIETGGITLGNAPGFGAEPFATIASLAARVKLAPLLRREVEIGRVVVEGIELNLSRDEALRGNWQDLTSPADGDARPDASGATGGATPGRLDVEGIRIRDGVVNWRENRTDLRFVASAIELETGAIRPAEPLEVTLAFTLLDVVSQIRLEMDSRVVAELRDADFEARGFEAGFRVVGADAAERASGDVAFERVTVANAGAVEIAGAAATTRVTNPAVWSDGMQFELAWERASFDNAAQSLSFDGLVTRAADTEAVWQIAGESLLDAPQLTGSMSLTAASAARLLDLFAVQAPAGVDPRTLGGVTATARFASEPNALKMRVTDIDARVLDLPITGAAEIDANMLRATIDVPRSRPTDALYAFADRLAPDSIDVRSVTQIALSGEIEADLDNGRATLRGINAELLGGTLSGDVAITPSAEGANLSGTLKTSRFPANAFAGVIGGFLPENIDAQEIGVVAIDTRFAYDAAADRATLNPLALEAFGLNASGNATVTAASTAPAVAGEVRLQPFAPRALLARLKQPVPQTSDPAAFREAAIDARFSVDANRGRFENLAVKLDESTITGSFTVTDFKSPSYQFDLSADRIDVDRYLPPPAEEAAEGERAAGDIELAPEPLNALRLEGRARVGALKLANLQFQDVATSLAIGGGKATIDAAQAKLYGGEFNGAFYVDTAGASPSMTLRGRAAGLALEPLIVALTGDANFSGTGSFDIDLTGRGPTVTDNLRSAAGTMRFTLSDGAIDGFNLGHVLCSAYNALQKLPAPPDQAKQTRYQLIQANATVADGVAASPELLARAPFMDVTGGGRLVLVEQTLDYDLRAKLTNSIQIPRCDSMDRLIGGSIPFTIRGTVTEAEIRPDFGQIIEDRVRDELRDRVQDRLRDRLRDLL